MSKTKNLNLNLTEEETLKFSDWRQSIDGNNPEGSESNIQLIDLALADRPTKARVEELIADLSSFKTLVINELPEIGDPNILYFILKPTTEQTVQNKYYKFIYVEDVWEQLSGLDPLYQTKIDELEAKVAEISDILPNIIKITDEGICEFYKEPELTEDGLLYFEEDPNITFKGLYTFDDIPEVDLQGLGLKLTKEGNSIYLMVGDLIISELNLTD